MDQILKEEQNVMLRENQYWIIISKSEEDFKAAVKESDIPINSNVLLSVREESTSENTFSFRFSQKRYLITNFFWHMLYVEKTENL